MGGRQPVGSGKNHRDDEERQHGGGGPAALQIEPVPARKAEEQPQQVGQAGLGAGGLDLLFDGVVLGRHGHGVNLLVSRRRAAGLWLK